MKISGRFVFVFQWIAPVVLVLWLLVGRGLVGSPLGWFTVIGLFIAPFLLLAMYISPVLVLFDRDARQAGRTRHTYEVVSYVLWGLMLVMGIVMVDGGDSGQVGSALTVWTGMDASTGEMFLVPVMILVVLALVAQIVVAVVGIVVGRKAAAAVAS